MDVKQSKLYPLLEKILSRESINEDTLPTNLEQWHHFIERISNIFYDLEQERYLLERSMEISSRELVELNERFETAQQIGHIGYWFYNRSANQIFWSKETYYIFGIDPTSAVPSFDTLMELIHEKDRPKLSELIEHALTEGKDYEYEFRINNIKSKNFVWVFVKGHPYKDKKILTSEKKSEYLLSGVIMDISARKKAEENLSKANQKLIILSRQAGMSEIATFVLHNIGNVLNSLSISIALIMERIEKSDIQNLIKVSQLINDNLEKHPDYLTADSKGKLIPAYLANFSKQIVEEYDEIYKEMINLTRNSNHIKDIVLMQKNISGISGINEKISLRETCNTAIEMSCAFPEKYGITIIRNYEPTDDIIIDKTKLLQILVNLISNAKDSLDSIKQKKQKQIIVSIKKLKIDPFVEISIGDNGVGISKDNLIKIFSLGFTTKETGHGFGLHSSSIAATELNGNLKVQSEGEGKGATFTLMIPPHPKTN